MISGSDRWYGHSMAAALLFIFVLVVQARAEDRSSRYDIIVIRQPFVQFGKKKDAKPPPPPPPPPPPVSFTRHLRMTAVTEWRGDSWVGFTYVQRKRRKHYFLRVGETEDGITVLVSDFARERAWLRKDGRSGWIAIPR